MLRGVVYLKHLRSWRGSVTPKHVGYMYTAWILGFFPPTRIHRGCVLSAVDGGKCRCDPKSYADVCVPELWSHVWTLYRDVSCRSGDATHWNERYGEYGAKVFCRLARLSATSC
jgi:hypothetical protein